MKCSFHYSYFVHSLVRTLSKTELMIKMGISKTQTPRPDPSMDHHSYIYISPHAFIPRTLS